MTVLENIRLKDITTFRAGGPARFVVEARSEDELREALTFSKDRNLPFYVLGGGSNTLPSDDGYSGVIIVPKLTSLVIEGESIIADAGVPWDTLVLEAAKCKLWGIENLAGIPGSVGAAPIQNIGAYGTEVKDVISFVEAMSIADGSITRFENAECDFSYRDSRFKKDESHIILRVGFKLQASGTANISYPDLQKAKEEGAALTTPHEVGNAVRAIRARKFPDLSVLGTAGSFFKNPIIDEQLSAELSLKYPELPTYPSSSGVKISLAYILDKVLGLRGYRKGSAWLFDKQPLVLVLDPNGSAHDAHALSEDVAAKVFAATKIKIEKEVREIK